MVEMKKRYQYFGREGIKWSEWYDMLSEPKKLEKWQLKGKLLNEYKKKQSRWETLKQNHLMKELY